MEQWRVKYSDNLFTLQRAERGAGLYDYDGREYGSVIIGSQEWLTSGYSPIHYADGTPIPHLPDDAEWATTTDGAWCYYGNSQENLSKYGRLYNQYAYSNPSGFVYLERHGAVELGWRIPSIADYATLFTNLGGGNIAGGKMKEMGTTYWLTPNVGATNSSGFYGRGGGLRSTNGTYLRLSEWYMMLATGGFSYYLAYNTSAVVGWLPSNREGMYARLVRDI